MIQHRSDICVIGAGPVGLTVASRLAERGATVVVLEAGGAEPTRSDLLSSTRERGGDPYPDLASLRTIGFGGTAAQWMIDVGAGADTGLRLAQLSPLDLIPRLDGGHDGWPIAWSELRQAYRDVDDLWGVEPQQFDAEASSLPHDARFTSERFAFRPKSVVVEALGERVRSHPSITTLTEHVVVGLLPKASTPASVASVRAISPEGLVSVDANRIVLALGGIGNAHLLMWAAHLDPRVPWSVNDNVGRFFMDHPLVLGGLLDPLDPDAVERLAGFDLDVTGGRPTQLCLSPNELGVRHGLPHSSISLFPRARVTRLERLGRRRFNASGHRTEVRHHLGRLRWAAHRRDLTLLPRELPPSVVTGIDDLAVMAWQRSGLSGREFAYHNGGWSTDDRVRPFEIFQIAEQMPDRDNRITLGTSLDSVGRRQPKVSWRMTEADRRRVSLAFFEFAQLAEGAGLGSVALYRTGTRLVITNPSAHHHMGTTRMGACPESSVVDANGKVHGCDNVWVVGTSMFASGGHAPPTFTACALAARLAAHLT